MKKMSKEILEILKILQKEIEFYLKTQEDKLWEKLTDILKVKIENRRINCTGCKKEYNDINTIFKHVINCQKRKDNLIMRQNTYEEFLEIEDDMKLVAYELNNKEINNLILEEETNNIEYEPSIIEKREEVQESMAFQELMEGSSSHRLDNQQQLLPNSRGSRLRT
ncbi:hypothetical protein ACH5RR_033816 [Cinchona calisaya]|uniref:BED-type domain-containing protein n=1 Tax=Cinchona calisaya TaxID=153742 RepID=A0ABD2YA11_9GENT